MLGNLLAAFYLSGHKHFNMKSNFDEFFYDNKSMFNINNFIVYLIVNYIQYQKIFFNITILTLHKVHLFCPINFYNCNYRLFSFLLNLSLYKVT